MNLSNLESLRKEVYNSQFSGNNESIAEQIASLSDEDIESFYESLGSLDTHMQAVIAHSWAFHGRPKQQPPDYCESQECGCGGNWSLWLCLAGRGFGKTRVGTEWVHEVAWNYPGCRIAVISPTAGDARRVMIEGDSGLMAKMKPWNSCVYEPTKTQITWENGSIAGVYSADEANRLRGPQHHFAWVDEVCAMPKAQEVWNMMKFGLRLPARPHWTRQYRPRVVVTTTPIATEFIRQLFGHRPFKKDPRTHVTVGSTYENRSNLDPDFFSSIIKDLEGTRLGRQELYGEILVDVPGALWKSTMIDPFRIEPEATPELTSVVVAIDPAAGGDNDTGIIIAGIGAGQQGERLALDEYGNLRKHQRVHGYVLADKSCRGTPDYWAKKAVEAYHDWKADKIVAESNQGGDMIQYTIATIDPSIKVSLVHATRGKKTRAEPIVALSEQGRIHMAGKFPKLEEELLTWDPELSPKSPDRLDAMVWAFSGLFGKMKTRTMPPPISIENPENYISAVASFGVGNGKRTSRWSFMV